MGAGFASCGRAWLGLQRTSSSTVTAFVASAIATTLTIPATISPAAAFPIANANAASSSLASARRVS